MNGVLRIVVARANGTVGQDDHARQPVSVPVPDLVAGRQPDRVPGRPAGKEQIYVVGATGGTVKRVTDGKAQNLAPGWGT